MDCYVSHSSLSVDLDFFGHEIIKKARGFAAICSSQKICLPRHRQ